MVVDFARIDLSENPVLILKNASDTVLGVINAYEISGDFKFNEVSELEFSVPSMIDGTPVPLYDELIGTRIVELHNIAQFTLINPTETNDGATRIKKCTAYSLEYEFSYKKMTLPDDTYRFWDENNPDNTMLGIIMSYMPSWHVGYVSETLARKYRTFEISNENLYNIMKNTLQQSYNCIFDFDTLTRTVNVIDVAEEASISPVFISTGNLAKSIEVSEQTEDQVTRLDVNGADGVNIRDVNPTGTNRIINLDYYMTPTNFSSELIAKYNTWKELCQSNGENYYYLSVQQVLKQMQKASEEAKLKDMQGELVSLQNQQAVIIQSIALGLSGVDQTDLDDINSDIADREAAMATQQGRINTLDSEIASIFGQLQSIVLACRFESYFTTAELKILDRYIKDGSVSEASFVVSENTAYISEDKTAEFTPGAIELTDFYMEEIDSPDESGTPTEQIYSFTGGKLTFKAGSPLATDMSADIVSAFLSVRTSDNSFVFSARLGSTSFPSESFTASSGSLSITGTSTSVAINDSTQTAQVQVSSGYRYFTSDSSEFEKRSVAWELYQYGEEVLEKLSQPTFSFSVTTANFFSAEEFLAFKNKFKLGQKSYLELEVDNPDRVLSPIAIGASFKYGDEASLNLSFGDSYVARDSTFKLVDLLQQSVSAGRDVEVSRYTYAAFVDSGASSQIKSFLRSTLDVAKNSIISSEEQAISWDSTGIRLRKWANNAHTAYENAQIWMSNNSIMMTDDGWQTASLAIGKFHDAELGDVYGIAAPLVVGKMLVGENLFIETEKTYTTTDTTQSGGTVQTERVAFKVNSDGARLYNSNLVVAREENGSVVTQVILSPDLGIAIGDSTAFTVDSNGNYVLDTTKAKFYADTNGNLHLAGYIYADGGYIGGDTGWVIGNRCMYINGASSLGVTGGTYIGTDGISVGGAVVMKNDGSFLLRKDNYSEDGGDMSYILKVEPDYATDGSENVDGEPLTDYKLRLGEITFEDEFFLEERFGGTGSQHYGIYRVNSAVEMNALPALNGDICVIYDIPNASVTGLLLNQPTDVPPCTPPGLVPLIVGNGSTRKAVSGLDNKQIGELFGLGEYAWNTDQATNDAAHDEVAMIGRRIFNSQSGASYGSPVAAVIAPIQLTSVVDPNGDETTASTITVVFTAYGAVQNLDSMTDSSKYSATKSITVKIYDSNLKLITSTARREFSIAYSNRFQPSAQRIVLNAYDGAFKQGEKYYIVMIGGHFWVDFSTINAVTTPTSASADRGLYIKSADAWVQV